MKKVIAGIIVLFLVLLFFMLNVQKKEESAYLYAANFAIYDALKALAPEGEKVKLFIPAGQDIHAFQPHPKMLVQAALAKKFYYVQGAMTSWLNKLVKQVSTEVLQEVGSRVEWVYAEDDDAHAHHHEHDENEYDPHYWLSISNQLAVANEIFLSLKTLYPKQLEGITTRYARYTEVLKDLDTRSKKLLNSCSKNTIIVTHNAFAYLAKSYGFHVESIAGISPQSMANPQKMDNIIKTIRQGGYETIFFETFISDLLARTIAKESAVNVDVLHPMATLTHEEMQSGKSYADLMEENIKKIAKAMQCH